jgi:glucosyl-3-phosphoglycerate synthase
VDKVPRVRPIGPVVRTYDHADFSVDELVAAKVGRSVSVCLPARDEEATVGDIVACIRAELMVAAPLVDEIVVVDDHSRDRTGAVAAAAGARVVRAIEVLPEYGEGHGKGEALWKSVYAATGDVIVWCDADIVGFSSHFVTGLLGPVLTTDDVGFVKGFYERSSSDGDRGGRVTELVARPLLSALFPALASIAQPLAGECAGRRDVLERLPFVEGYGVDIGLLIDVAERDGVGTIAQVDLGRRVHRNRPLDELAPQATAVMQAVLARAGRALPEVVTLERPGLAPVDVDRTERPPLVDVASYRHLSHTA